MKIVAISDLHGHLIDTIPKGDVLTISGDICPVTNHNAIFQEDWLINKFIPWCETVGKKYVKDIIFIPGNHDKYLEKIMNSNNEEDFRKKLPKNIHYLRDSEVIINNVKFYGTPFTPTFCNWYFMKLDHRLDTEVYNKIPENTDILLCHGPAKGYNDCVEEFNETDHLGSSALLKHIKRIKPKWVFTGHIHSGSHIPSKIIHDDDTQTQLVNVSILDEHYTIHYTPFECEI